MAIYIHFSDDVKGTSKAVGHEEWINVKSWDWTCARESSGGNVSGRVSGVARFDGLSFTADTGSATATLFLKMLQATHFEEILIHSIKSVGGDEPEPWYVVTLKNSVITSINQNIESDAGTDTFTITFESFNIKIADQLATGELDTEMETEWDFSTLA